jgi:hypothetical protein
MSLPRDALLFSIVLMLWAVQIETSGYGSSESMVFASLGLGLIGLAGSFFASMTAVD